MRKRIVSLDIITQSYQHILSDILQRAKNRNSSYVCFANVHMTIEAYRNSDFADKVNNATLVLPDGKPLAIAIKLLYGIGQERVAGMDMMPDVIYAAEEQKLSVYFFGSTEEVLSAIKSRIKKEHPALRIAGTCSPPFGSLKELNEKFIDDINASGANIVMVALGCPKQESWMAENYKKINAVLLGVGGAFPVYAGLQKRAPQWMQNASLEWLYRFVQEPGRMWKRYLVTNSMFLWLLFKQLLKGKFRRKEDI